jgi:hypothetical protein
MWARGTGVAPVTAMMRTIGLLSVAWICSACALGEQEVSSGLEGSGIEVDAAPPPTDGSGSGSGSGGADPCTITFDTKCKVENLPIIIGWPPTVIIVPTCMQQWGVPRMTIADPDGHVRPNCGFNHNVQRCGITPTGACDLIGGGTTKCQ